MAVLRGCFRSGPIVAAFILIVENRELWVRLEKIGFIRNEPDGVME
jgi:hypothetical protein